MSGFHRSSERLGLSQHTRTRLVGVHIVLLEEVALLLDAVTPGRVRSILFNVRSSAQYSYDMSVLDSPNAHGGRLPGYSPQHDARDAGRRTAQCEGEQVRRQHPPRSPTGYAHRKGIRGASRPRREQGVKSQKYGTGKRKEAVSFRRGESELCEQQMAPGPNTQRQGSSKRAAARVADTHPPGLRPHPTPPRRRGRTCCTRRWRSGRNCSR